MIYVLLFQCCCTYENKFNYVQKVFIFYCQFSDYEIKCLQSEPHLKTEDKKLFGEHFLPFLHAASKVQKHSKCTIDDINCGMFFFFLSFLLEIYISCNVSLYHRCGQGHLRVFFSLSLWNMCAKFNPFSSINCIRQMEFFHPVSKSCWARLMFSGRLYLSQTLPPAPTPLHCHIVLCSCLLIQSAAGAPKW